jgi:O-methyltransferase
MNVGRQRWNLIFELIFETIHIPGDILEIGVYKGATFKRLILESDIYRWSKKVYGIDSFQGLSHPGDFDIRDDASRSTPYPRGRFNVGGVKNFRDKFMSDVDPTKYDLFGGWIPQVFERVPKDLRFCVVLIDVDHYRPTIDSLNWAWDRVSPYGILIGNNFEVSTRLYAGRAYNDWLSDRHAHFEAWTNLRTVSITKTDET